MKMKAKLILISAFVGFVFVLAGGVPTAKAQNEVQFLECYNQSLDFEMLLIEVGFDPGRAFEMGAAYLNHCLAEVRAMEYTAFLKPPQNFGYSLFRKNEEYL